MDRVEISHPAEESLQTGAGNIFLPSPVSDYPLRLQIPQWYDGATEDDAIVSGVRKSAPCFCRSG